MAPSWRPLGSIPQSPPLLIRYKFEPSQYKIHLTDLTYIWTETLERKQIFKRALNTDTSIDPSETPDQLRLLLRKIQNSLEGAEGTKLSLSRGENPGELVLRTIAQLPHPFKPLEWPIHLASAPRNSLTTELLLPCLSEQFVAKAQVESLLQFLKEKDHVIGKLADRMQLDGVDFGTLFPGALGLKTGAKLSNREHAGKLVKGLNEFNETQWRKALSATLSSSPNLQDVIPRIFVPDMGDTLKIDGGTNYGDWLEKLEKNDPQEFLATEVSRQIKPLQDPTARQGDNPFGEDFQKQDIPARVKTPSLEREYKPAIELIERSKQKKKKADSDSGSTTVDESDGDIKLRKPQGFPPRETSAKLSTSVVEFRRSPKVIRHSRQDYRSETESPTSPLPRGSIKALEEPTVENEPGPESLPIEKPRTTEAVQKPKGKLGKIGGMAKREKEMEPIDHAVRARPTTLTAASTPVTVDRGRKEMAQVPTNTVGLTAVGRAPVRPKYPVTPLETSQERANNKREELKRQLESKSNANVKKKRKF